jgi:thymidylate synthase
MSYAIQPYDEALELLLKKGKEKSNKRTGIKTKFLPGILSRYDLTQSFPLVTKRKIWPKSIWAELLWFISGSTNNNDLNALGAKIWDPWVDPEFEKKHGYAEKVFGPVYGFQLRHFGGYYGNGIGGKEFTNEVSFDPCGEDLNSTYNKNQYGSGGFDQLDFMVNRIKEDSSCRRILFSLWNPKEVSKMKLPCCHYSFQISIDDNGEMTGSLTQRSADFPIGVPANIQFYSALTMMLAQQTGYKATEFVHYTVDSHIYWDQIPAMEEYLSLPSYDCPNLTINKAEDIYSYKLNDFVLSDYKCGPKLEIPVAV